MNKSTGYICTPRVYKFEGWIFEYNGYATPWPLRKNGDPKEKVGRKFWNIISRFEKLSYEEKKQFRIGGGCVRI